MTKIDPVTEKKSGLWDLSSLDSSRIGKGEGEDEDLFMKAFGDLSSRENDRAKILYMGCGLGFLCHKDMKTRS